MPGDLAGLAAGAATIGLLHAVLPTHWLPFALVARAQGWSRGRRLAVTAAAAAGHALVTGAVGLAAAALGYGLAHALAEHAERIAGIFLVAFGAVYIVFDIRHLGHRHLHHAHDGVMHDSHHHASAGFSDKAAIAGLVAVLSVSPCVALFPIFLETGRLGLGAVLAVAGINAAVTVPTMTLMAGLAAEGLGRLKLERIERYERVLVGGLLVAIGAVVLLWHEH